MCTMRFMRLPRTFYCSFCLCLCLIFLKKNMLGQKKIFNWFYWKYFTFSYLQPLIFCDRGTIPTCSLCVRAVIQDKSVYRLLHSKLFVHKEIFQSEFSDTYLPNMITLFFCRRKSFSQRQLQTFMISIRKKLLRNLFLLLFEIYLEIVCRVFFTSVAFLIRINRLRQMKMILPSFIIPFQSIYVRK